MADLRQILSQGRKRIGLLVGAGAPLAIRVDKDGKLAADGTPLIPGVEQLTKVTLANLGGAEAEAISAIKKELGDKANIETILSRIRLMETALGTIVANGLDGNGYRALGKAICAKIGAIVGVELPQERNAYSELVSWVSGTPRDHAVEIFTTNYDLLFDEAFERVRVPYFDGFAGSSSPFFDPVSVASDDLPPRWSRLWKLHGSVGWEQRGEVVIRGRGRSATQLIYPDHLKYDLTQKQPYSALFERLKEFLLTPDSLLLAVGFSFRDAHVSAVISESLAMNANSAVFAFQFQSLAQEEPACRLAFNHPNLSVYAENGAVINGVSGLWRPGDLPKNWEEIRRSFWGVRQSGHPACFLLGDFPRFTRFCALAQATEIARPPGELDTDDRALDEAKPTGKASV